MKKTFTPKLSPRLEGIVSLLPECEKVADIGCDHGYISISLVQRGIAKSAVACDIKAGPLEFAKKNIAKSGLTDLIDVRLSPGLNKLSEGEADAIVIAGMGMRTIAGIILDDLSKAKAADYILIQAQSEIPEMRRFFEENGFTLLRNKLMIEEDKYYFAMLLTSKKEVEEEYLKSLGGGLKRLKERLTETGPGPEFSEFAESLDEYFGLDLITNDGDMKKYLGHVIGEWSESIEKISGAKKPDFEKMDELKKKLAMAEHALELNTLFKK